MDNILEIIGPIIVGIFYIVGSIVDKKNKAKESSPDPLQDHDFEAEEEEYQRQVQSQGRTPPITDPRKQNPSPIPNLSKQRLQAESEHSRDFSWDQSDDSYDNEMEAQLKKIEATKREAARLQSQSTHKRIQTNREISNLQTTRPISSSRSVRSSLKDPKAARSAFIYGEVLGPPVSLRKSTGVPGRTS
ncbi:MAG: hypothetical protein ACSHX6_02340 [Akkermansiaceae bacterium]